MGIYKDLGIEPIINASATLTILGGSVMPPEVLEAMTEASRNFVNLKELQLRIGERLAELTHNEAAYVSSGAAAGLVLATAACIAGDNPAAIDQLPDLTGLKNEVVVHRAHRNGYDHAVRQVGVKLVEIGNNLGTREWELENAINENTAAVFWFQGAMTGHGDIPLQRVCDIANARGIPVIVDAAAQLPPTENLWRFTEMGAALTVFSGGKDLRGPQSSGLIVGRKDLIEAIRLNGNPNYSIARPMKVGKEEMVGLLTAIQMYLEIDQEGRASQDEETVIGWNTRLNTISGVSANRSYPNEAGQPLPRTAIHIDGAKLGKNRDQVVNELNSGSPSISVSTFDDDGIYLNPMTLADGEDEQLADRLMEILTES